MTDLLFHFVAGGIISAAVLLIFSRRKPDGKRPDGYVIAAIALSFIAGLAKEFNDLLFQYSAFDVADLALTWSGGIFAALLIIFIDMFTPPKPTKS